MIESCWVIDLVLCPFGDCVFPCIRWSFCARFVGDVCETAKQFWSGFFLFRVCACLSTSPFDIVHTVLSLYKWDLWPLMRFDKSITWAAWITVEEIDLTCTLWAVGCGICSPLSVVLWRIMSGSVCVSWFSDGEMRLLNQSNFQQSNIGSRRTPNIKVMSVGQSKTLHWNLPVYSDSSQSKFWAPYWRDCITFDKTACSLATDDKYVP